MTAPAPDSLDAPAPPARLAASVLRWGGWAAALAITAGLACMLAAGPTRSDFATYSPGITPEAVAGGDRSPAALALAGVVLLLSTPVARVLVAGFALAGRREWVLAATSLGSLVAIGAGLVLGAAA